MAQRHERIGLGGPPRGDERGRESDRDPEHRHEHEVVRSDGRPPLGFPLTA